MISARDGGGIGSNRNKNGVTFWFSDSLNDAGQLRDINNWRRVRFAQFRKALIDACAQFPDLPPEQQEEEKHLALCIHGYNSGFASSIDLYTRVCNSLFAGSDSLGICVLFTWPSKGEVYDYLADREPAPMTLRACSMPFTREVLQRLILPKNLGFARKPSCLSVSKSTTAFSAKSRKRRVFRQNRKVATLPF
jgi:hypothetical protein